MAGKSVIDPDRIRLLIDASISECGRGNTARKARIGPTTLDNILDGDIRGLRLESLDAISAAFGVPPELLISPTQYSTADTIFEQLGAALRREGFSSKDVESFMDKVQVSAMLCGIRAHGFGHD